MPPISRGLGIEDLVDLMVDTLEAKLNDQLAVIAAMRDPLDEARAARRGVPYVPITLDPIPPTGFHTGSVPSFIMGDDLEPGAYPYVAVTFDDESPDPEDARHDHLNVYRNILMIHTIAKATLAEGPEFAWRRAVRMSEAAYRVVQGDAQLKRVEKGASNPMRALISEPFRVSIDGIDDNDFLWQTAGAQYVAKNYTFPEEV
jgi:hypothetical protein